MSALNITYGYSDILLSPEPISAFVSDSQVVIDFLHAGGGLICTLLSKVSEFELCYVDSRCEPAKAKISHSQVRVDFDIDRLPVLVRYIWSDVPSTIVFNNDDLPAPPFKMEIAQKTP